MTDSPTQPVYRITVCHEPCRPADSIPYVARVYRLSDGEHVQSVWDEHARQALDRAREWVAQRHLSTVLNVSYVDVAGELTAPPTVAHSVRA